ncbi:MAG: hypothetical protein R6X02_23180 [Enhygromyxa sp.]
MDDAIIKGLARMEGMDPGKEAINIMTKRNGFVVTIKGRKIKVYPLVAPDGSSLGAIRSHPPTPPAD